MTDGHTYCDIIHWSYLKKGQLSLSSELKVELCLRHFSSINTSCIDVQNVKLITDANVSLKLTMLEILAICKLVIVVFVVQRLVSHT